MNLVLSPEFRCKWDDGWVGYIVTVWNLSLSVLCAIIAVPWHLKLKILVLLCALPSSPSLGLALALLLPKPASLYLNKMSRKAQAKVGEVGDYFYMSGYLWVFREGCYKALWLSLSALESEQTELKSWFNHLLVVWP